VVNYLLQQGANALKGDNRGYNSLHHAVQYGRGTTAHLLVSRGVYTDSVDLEGHTPLMWAAYRDHEVISSYLCLYSLNTGMREISVVSRC
jgi:ankyrin repeat protein